LTHQLDDFTLSCNGLKGSEVDLWLVRRPKGTFVASIDQLPRRMLNLMRMPL
jgi:hypothetical protein